MDVRESKSDASSWGFLCELVKPHWRSLGSYGLALVIATTLPIAAALLLSKFVQLATERAPQRELVRVAAIYASLGILSGAVSVLVTWRANIAAWAITNTLRYQLTADVLRADLSFHRDRTPGELVTRVDGDITSMTRFIASVVAQLVGVVALGVVSVVVALVVEPFLAPFLAVGFGGVVWVAHRLRNHPVEQTMLERAAEADLMSSAEQYLAGADDLAALGAGSFAVTRIGERAGALVEAARIRVARQMAMQSSISVASVANGTLMIAAGGWLMSIGRISIAGVVLGLRLAMTVTDKIGDLVWQLQDAQGASGAARRVMELALMRNEVRTGNEQLPEGDLAVRFENVGLVYDDDAGTNAAVNRLNLTLRPGRMLGVVGRTGSGKTSVARLVLRLVEPTAGELTVGGLPIGSIDEVNFRQRITAVPQEVQLFPGTVAQNVTLFSLHPPAEITAALTAVGLGPWLAELPRGLDTQLAVDDRDDGGARVGLSSGQAQLLALSRALLRNPSVVVLDEATSRIDTGTQTAIGDALAALVAGRTALVIAHRLETLDACDDIVVLADGALVEYGERKTLAADATSHYARIRLIGHGAEELQ